MVRRIRGHYDEESPARAAGLTQQAKMEAGFACECGTQQHFGKYTREHWSDVHQHRCAACGRVWRVKAGDAKLVSGPNRRPARIGKQQGTDQLVDPNKALWRVYHRLNNGPRAVTHAPASDYHEELDAANEQAFNYASRLEPHSRSKRDDLYRSFIRKKEFPLLSGVIVDGMSVGSGHLQMIGTRADETRQCSVVEFELRDPIGSVTRISLTPEVWQVIVDGMELKEAKPGPATRTMEAFKKGKL